MGRMVLVSSPLGGLPRSWLSWLWLWDGRGGGFPSDLRDWRSPLAVAPALSLRTGFVSHFFKVLTERLEPGELGAELPDACGGSDTTEVEMLPSLPAAEYESRERKREKRGEFRRTLNIRAVKSIMSLQSYYFLKTFLKRFRQKKIAGIS